MPLAYPVFANRRHLATQGESVAMSTSASVDMLSAEVTQLALPCRSLIKALRAAHPDLPLHEVMSLPGWQLSDDVDDPNRYLLDRLPPTLDLLRTLLGRKPAFGGPMPDEGPIRRLVRLAYDRAGLPRPVGGLDIKLLPPSMPLPRCSIMSDVSPDYDDRFGNVLLLVHPTWLDQVRRAGLAVVDSCLVLHAERLVGSDEGLPTLYKARWIEEIDGELEQCEGLLAQGGGVIVAEPGDLKASGHADLELTSRVLEAWRQTATGPRPPAGTSCRLPSAGSQPG